MTFFYRVFVLVLVAWGWAMGTGGCFGVEGTPQLVSFNFLIRPGQVHQGNSFVTEVTSSHPISAIELTFDGQTNSMLRTLAPKAGIGPGSYRYALYTGTQMDTLAGNYPVILTFTLANGRRFKKTVYLDVLKTDFPKTVLSFSPEKQAIVADRDTLGQEAMLLTQSFKKQTPTPYFSDGFIQPAQGNITSEFGSYREYPTFASAKHRGLDIGNVKGTPVVAANSGVVSLSKSLKSHGDTILIDHGLGIVTVYNHLSERLVSTGQFVTRGQIIGRMGDSGIATGPHLHFGVSVLNVRVNPVDFFQIELN